jgi:hypothetical protein
MDSTEKVSSRLTWEQNQIQEMDFPAINKCLYYKYIVILL